MSYIVYKTTNLLNGKFYIGVHNGENEKYLGSGRLLRCAIKKYGVENFIRETLMEFNNAIDAYDYEKTLITDDLIQSSDCYNIGPGGHGGDKISWLDPVRKADIYKQNSIRRSGVKDSKEIRIIKSNSSKLRCVEKPHTIPNNKGRKHTGKALQNIRENNKSKDSCFISNGIIELKIPKNTSWVLGNGFYYGRSEKIKLGAKERTHPVSSKNKIRDYNTGLRCFNNGVKNIKIKQDEPIPEGYKPGLLKRIKNIWATDGVRNLRLREGDEIPVGFKRGRTINVKSVV